MELLVVLLFIAAVLSLVFGVYLYALLTSTLSTHRRAMDALHRELAHRGRLRATTPDTSPLRRAMGRDEGQ